MAKIKELEKQMDKENAIFKYLESSADSISLDINNSETSESFCFLLQGTELEWSELENGVTTERKKLLESNESMKENQAEILQKIAKLDEVEAKIKELREMTEEDIHEMKNLMLEKLKNECLKINQQIRKTIESSAETPERQLLLNLIAKKSELNIKLSNLVAEIEQFKPNQQSKQIKELKIQLAENEGKHQQEVEQLKLELQELKMKGSNDNVGIIENITGLKFSFRGILIIFTIITVIMFLFSKFSRYSATPKTKRWGIALVSNEPKSICLEW